MTPTTLLAHGLYLPTAKDYLRSVHYQALDLIVSVLDKRFSNLESFSSYAQIETLLVKVAIGDDYESEFKFLETSYCPLSGQLSVLEAMLKIKPKKKLF